ncbi:YmaF family protein [Clostridium sp. CM028]|nr:YmaF family protein [Clostridium sp. CM027]MBW9149627.1 YmaF family protein [Clostridium sp. CM028]UVE42786.1 YmaF family protein [Clostridium sp. CM027]WLC63446.1 YmaF family protein [Clostridium sp. CM028]
METKYHPEDWCVEKDDCEDQCDFEEKHDDIVDVKDQCDFEKKLDDNIDNKDHCDSEKKLNDNIDDKDHCDFEKKLNDNIDDKDHCDSEKKQFHVHEFEGSTTIAELEETPPNHRFAGVSSPAISVSGGHIHKVKSRTDCFDHLHYFEATSGLQIPVGNGKHVHLVKITTSVNDFHSHKLIFVTLIDSPILEEKNSINTPF